MGITGERLGKILFAQVEIQKDFSVSDLGNFQVVQVRYVDMKWVQGRNLRNIGC